jgi:hypothetical protein
LVPETEPLFHPQWFKLFKSEVHWKQT